jgi:hypothetical protein
MFPSQLIEKPADLPVQQAAKIELIDREGRFIWIGLNRGGGAAASRWSASAKRNAIHVSPT